MRTRNRGRCALHRTARNTAYFVPTYLTHPLPALVIGIKSVLCLHFTYTNTTHDLTHHRASLGMAVSLLSPFKQQQHWQFQPPDLGQALCELCKYVEHSNMCYDCYDDDGDQIACKDGSCCHNLWNIICCLLWPFDQCVFYQGRCYSTRMDEEVIRQQDIQQALQFQQTLVGHSSQYM